ncbi:unnamed protein product [Sympodiomycopsis kandeliae]
MAESSSSSSSTTSLRGQRILQEESYVDSLSALIQREFFPNLPRITAENDYLSALEDFDQGVDGAEERKRDAEWTLDFLDDQDKGIGSSKRHTESKGLRNSRSSSRAPVPNATPLDTPSHSGRHGWDPTPTPVSRMAGWDTPRTSQSTTMTPSRSSRRERHDHNEQLDGTNLPDLSNHTLASFQRTYTSEDNASFLSLIQSTNDQRRDKYAWAFDQEKRHNDRRKLILQEAAKRADEGYSRSVMALPEPKRRKLIQSGKLKSEITSRVLQLEKLHQWEEDRKQQRLITRGRDQDVRMIRAGSEESTSATASLEQSSFRHASLFANRPRSASPPPPSGLRLLKHSLNPTSEVSLAVSEREKVDDAAEEKDDLFDPDAILRQAPPRTSAATSAGTKWSVRNALFYGPDANIGTTDKSTSSLPHDESTSNHLLNASIEYPRRTNFHNTALPWQGLFPENRYPGIYKSDKKQRVSSSSSSTTASIRSSRIQSALEGGSKYGDNFDDQDGHDLRYKGPTVNGYGFVTPQREGEEEELRKMQALQTSGNTSLSSKDRIEQMRLRNQSKQANDPTAAAKFAIPATPKRDQIAYSLASAHNLTKSSKHTSSLRQSLGLGPHSSQSTRTPAAKTPSSRRAEHLSPAARTLLGRSTGLGGSTPLSKTPVSAASEVTRHRSTSEAAAKQDATMKKFRKKGWDDI